MIGQWSVLRSRSPETVFGAPLHDLHYQHLEPLVTNNVPEAIDLDFKAELYGNSAQSEHGNHGSLVRQRSTSTMASLGVHKKP
jgi:hypothetical protein